MRQVLGSNERVNSLEIRSGRRLALVVEYDGTEYAGFQLQLNAPTIQGEIEKALKRFTGENIRIRAASRTDSGAHALGQVVDFVSESTHSAETLIGALNYYLPRDIRITKACETLNIFHSRRAAQSRVYQYRILNRPFPSPLFQRHYHWLRDPLKIDRMNLAAQDLVGTHDFRPFAPSHPTEKSSVREVHRWEVRTAKEDENVVIITCEANGFMQHQIRRTNAVLIEIGKGTCPQDAIRIILGDTQNTSEDLALHSIPTLPARGLWLWEVKYRNSWIQGEDYHEEN